MKVLDIPNWDTISKLMKNVLYENPDIRKSARKLPEIYLGNRGLMIVDVVCSRQRKYENYVKSSLLPRYKAEVQDLSLNYLSTNAPDWMPLRQGEAQTMRKAAEVLINYGVEHRVVDEDEICFKWSHDIDSHHMMLDVKGIGPALLQYMRMLSGADTLKVDVRVIETLREVGLPVHWFSAEGILQLCKDMSREIGCSLVELDQLLWHFVSLRNK